MRKFACAAPAARSTTGARSMAVALMMAAALSMTAASTARANVTVENFQLDTMGDLMALCGVDAADPNAVAAIHMCHGYFVGLVHFHAVMGRALEGYIYCMKDEERPTRDQAIAMIVEWSRAHPENNDLEAVDGVLKWAAETYPCSE